MRTLIITCFCLGALISPQIVKAQNGPTGPIALPEENIKLKITVLVILKTDTGDVRTNNLFVMSDDIEKLDLPAKGIASKTMGPIAEDVVAIFTVKKSISLLRLPDLLAKYHIDAKYQHLPIYVDDKPVTHPGPVIVADYIVKSVAIVNSQIHITTNTAGKGTLGFN